MWCFPSVILFSVPSTILFTEKFPDPLLSLYFYLKIYMIFTTLLEVLVKEIKCESEALFKKNFIFKEEIH